ncbi:hypothetical protein A2548_02605 [candidate division WOR-1 bacterium RIFOXYD2_FULL_41_8]|nr:MAG: hypothetical protein A2548_02605 [candidate division WOR-1 bacterium RIFOXYD2_FULL_41_8]
MPRYRVIKETGPRHRRVFWMEVKVCGKRYGIGKGRNKKESEQRAATRALNNLKAEELGGRKKEGKGIKGLISKVRKRIGG